MVTVTEPLCACLPLFLFSVSLSRRQQTCWAPRKFLRLFTVFRMARLKAKLSHINPECLYWTASKLKERASRRQRIKNASSRARFVPFFHRSLKLIHSAEFYTLFESYTITDYVYSCFMSRSCENIDRSQHC